MNTRRSAPPRSHRSWIAAIAGSVVLVIVVVLIVVSSGDGSSSTASGRPSVVLNPAPSPSIRGGQYISVSVGPNKYFAPYTRIEIIECADPGGTTAHLPTSDLTCDGNTAPGFSVLVNKDGSFSAARYQVYSLPNTVLGEARDNEPVCNATHECVLYVGQDQNNFTAPKVFSVPFTVSPPGPSSSGGG